MSEKTQEKKYRVGYTQGVFDMFHVGHLNLLKHAKELCDYLIVGINTDELVRSYKRKEAIVPIEERKQIVQAIRYVDEVIEVNTLDKEEIWKDKSFDAVFIGNDWKGTPRWLETEAQMKKHGVVIEYLPYTKGTTSTILREKISELQ